MMVLKQLAGNVFNGHVMPQTVPSATSSSHARFPSWHAQQQADSEAQNPVVLTLHDILQVGPIVPALLRPLVDKLAQSESSPFVVQLLLVIAQLVHLDTNQLIECLAVQPAPGALPAPCCLGSCSCHTFCCLTAELTQT